MAEIMIVDDDASFRSLLGQFLALYGHRVVPATDGAHAMRLLRKSRTKPSLILLDLAMPRVDGWGFRKLQLADPALAAIPVVVITARRNEPNPDGVCECFWKPLDPAKLLDFLDHRLPGGSA